jgi:hypothetical protein
MVTCGQSPQTHVIHNKNNQLSRLKYSLCIMGDVYMDEMSQFRLSCVGPLVYLLPKTFKLFCFPIFWLWAYLMKGYSRNALYTLNSVYMFLLPKKRAYLTKVQRYNGYAYLPMTRRQNFCNIHDLDNLVTTCTSLIK